MKEIKNERKIDKLKNFLKKDWKMRSLVLCVFLNIVYVFVTSFLVTIKVMKIKYMSKGFIALLILNIFVGLAIIIKKRYKKDWIHLCIVLILLFRSNFQYFCNKSRNCNKRNWWKVRRFNYYCILLFFIFYNRFCK